MDKEEMEIWEEYRGKGDSQSRNVLVQYYLPMLKGRAEIFHREHPGLADQDDIIMAGIFGLIDSIKEFDREAGVDFEKFCAGKIRENMMEEIADVGKILRKIWNGLANRETLIVGLKEHENMTFAEIAELVDRDEFEIKKVYEGAGVKLGRRAPYTV
ncbi:MAG: hypothetical protein J7M30_17240 [Deltaproteobacteria bacterium]|nr:hypothetical protein [Deltaproteobacteria bacterium]